MLVVNRYPHAWVEIREKEKKREYGVIGRGPTSSGLGKAGLVVPD